MSFLLHFLRPQDLFIDIGANIGSYTVLASAHVGANSLAIEPVPSTFVHLMQNIDVNKMAEKVTPLNIAVGAEKGVINFTSAQDATNHVATKDDQDIIQVPIETLDGILQNQPIPALMKIDVEGFETEVIKGASKTLANEGLKAVIIELNGSGWRYGYNDRDINNILISFGFSPFLYKPKERLFTENDKLEGQNTIYIRDMDFVKKRVKTAASFKINGNTI